MGPDHRAESGEDAPAGRVLEGRLRPVERTSSMSLRRVRKSYEQVADQLRELIIGGRLERGERLPNETQLATEFGVSRATVREALRLLAAQNLIRTTKGAGGGSYVTIPTVDHLSDYMSSNIGLLADAQDLTLAELIEARMLIEVPAARLAAARRGDDDLERMRSAIPVDSAELDSQREFEINSDFHSSLIRACRNRLITIAMQPLFSALQVNLRRSGLGREFHLELHRHHHDITGAIADADADAAGSLMESHLRFLVPFYESAWADLRSAQ